MELNLLVASHLKRKETSLKCLQQKEYSERTQLHSWWRSREGDRGQWTSPGWGRVRSRHHSLKRTKWSRSLLEFRGWCFPPGSWKQYWPMWWKGKSWKDMVLPICHLRQKGREMNTEAYPFLTPSKLSSVPLTGWHLLKDNWYRRLEIKLSWSAVTLSSCRGE